jgi:hypothetical protein
MELNIEGRRRIINHRRWIKRHYIVSTLILLSLLLLIVLSSMFYGVVRRVELNEFYDKFPQDLDDISHFVQGKFSQPQTIYLDIKFKDYSKLSDKRNAALEQGFLIKEEGDEVPATLTLDNQPLDIRIRLKGDWVRDHLTGKKWSFRVNVRGENAFLGMDEFSLQRPNARNYIHEWIFHKALKSEDLIGLRYDFINLIVNGDNLGIYALEEHFTKELIENNQRREGVILGFDEGLIWQRRSQTPYYVEQTDAWIEDETFLSVPIKAYENARLNSNPTLQAQYLKARTLLESFRAGDLKTDAVFDVKKYATFLALTDLFAAEHGMIYNNLRFYYNPVTSKLEPVGFDASTGEKISNLIYSPQNPLITELFIGRLFEDIEFTATYLSELERLSKKNYLDQFFSDIETELEKNLKIIYKETPSFDFSKELYYQNQDFIRESLTPPKLIQTYFKEQKDKVLVLQIGNIQTLPIELIHLNYKDEIILAEEKILYGKNPLDLVKYEGYKFQLPSNIFIEKEALSLTHKILGTSTLTTEKVIPLNLLNEDFLEIPTSNIREFSFLNLDEANKIISIEVGTWAIEKDLIIPPGFSFQIHPATKIDLIKDASITSYSPLYFLGTKNSPIVIDSTDGKGLIVINAGRESILDYVNVEGLSDPSKQGMGLTGALTFYESPLSITNSLISSGDTEDLLNIIRSKFVIENTVIRNGNSDCLDVDFGSGSIINSRFENCSNDGADFSGSQVELRKIIFSGMGDKALSIGEASNVKAEDISIENVNIAIANKDSSFLEVKDLDINNATHALTAYQKKPEFGSSDTRIENIKLKAVSTPYLIEENSILYIDGKLLDESVVRNELIERNIDGLK